MIIDFSAHVIAPKTEKILMKKPYFRPSTEKGVKYFPYPPRHAEPEALLSLMEKYGIDIMMLSPTAPVLLGFEAEEAALICKLSNDYIYELCNKYPHRFVGCALVSLLDVNSALEELERAVGELGFKCVTVSTNQKGKGLDSSEFHPFYEKVVKYDVPIFLHPTCWEGYPLVSLEGGLGIMTIFGWPFDTTQAAWRLIFGGVLDRFPALKIVMHHLGGMLPYFSRRAFAISLYLQKKMPRPLKSYIEQIYGDTALYGGPVESLMCGYAFFGPDRMLFGSDYPFARESLIFEDSLACIRAMPIPQEEKDKILYRNAKKLLKLP
jgi:aminocarboxymuconate-semialdehyde decarboxylase